MRIAINTITTKKAAGGGFQIAYNFIKETLLHQDEIEWFYITSSDLDEVLGNDFEALRGSRYFVFPTQPDFLGSYRQVRKALLHWEEKYKPDLIYTITSPCYFTFRTTEVMRFANAWVTNPNKESWHTLSVPQRVYNYLFFIYQRRYIKKCNYFITQSETVAQGLAKISKQPRCHIKVVPNVLPAVFKNARVEKRLSIDWIDVACIGNPFPHKNIKIVPSVLKSLKDKGVNNIRFHLTIPEGNKLWDTIIEECKECGLSKNVINHGRCSQLQLISVYNQCSICFLPTLLETFSATSLEAMHFNLDIVASDYSFNREVIEDAGLYFQSLNAKDAAEKILMIINSEPLRSQMKGARIIKMKEYGNYENHIHQIISFLLAVGEKVKQM